MKFILMLVLYTLVFNLSGQFTVEEKRKIAQRLVEADFCDSLLKVKTNVAELQQEQIKILLGRESNLKDQNKEHIIYIAYLEGAKIRLESDLKDSEKRLKKVTKTRSFFLKTSVIFGVLSIGEAYFLFKK